MSAANRQPPRVTQSDDTRSVRIVDVHVRPYRLPLHRPWVAAAGTMPVRLGSLLRLTMADGMAGWGDCAPLPSSGEAGYRRTLDELRALADHCVGANIDAALGRLHAVTCSEVRWALETAVLDAQARRQGLPLYQFLGGSPVDGVRANAALGPLDGDCAHRAQRAIEKGFLIAKIKVGIESTQIEAKLLRHVVDATSGKVQLRLDANRAWQTDEAERFLDAISDLPIDGVEEPLATPTIDALRHLQAKRTFPIAVDESLPALGADRLLAARAVRRLVIKPARMGSLTSTLQLAKRACSAGIEVVLTSVVDTSIGVIATAHLGAVLPDRLTHGIATLDWLVEDVATAPSIVAGKMRLLPDAGLGLVPWGAAP